MKDCWSCKAKFTVKFHNNTSEIDSDEDKTTFCPSCGEEIFEEINMSEGHYYIDDTGEEEWE